MSKLLKKFIAWLPLEAIGNNLPEAFIKTRNNECRVILECTEVFIERPKSLDCQAATWSLVGISPSGFITFLNSCYGGRASDRFITKDSGFYDFLERDDVVMADGGFQIQEDQLLHFCNLQVLLGARTKSWMTKKEVQKAKEIYEFTLRELWNC